MKKELKNKIVSVVLTAIILTVVHFLMNPYFSQFEVVAQAAIVFLDLIFIGASVAWLKQEAENWVCGIMIGSALVAIIILLAVGIGKRDAIKPTSNIAKHKTEAVWQAQS